MIVKNLKLSKSEIILFIFFAIFSSLLMFKTFNLSPEGNLKIATKAWSDFAATIPLIRSFSLGSNFPPQYPIFAGPAIRYHFGFYLLVGILEKLGLPIKYALNIPSIFGFTFLLIIIYYFSKKVFASKSVGVISVILFLFNGSFSFLEFFKKYPFSNLTFSQVVKNTSFPSFGPYDGKTVSAFWNLNIYTNQRHLAIAYSVFLLIFYLINRYSEKPDGFSYKKAFILGLSIGLFPFIHYAVFGMLGILLLISFLLYPKIRLKIVFAGLTSLYIAIPQVLYMGSSNLHINLFRSGYLINDLNIMNFLNYWFLNVGLGSVLCILGFIFASNKQRKIFLPFLALFIIGNLIQVSPEIAANHKFFNLFIIGANMFTAYFLVKIWQSNILAKFLVLVVFPIIILSGVIDLFPIFNDGYITLEDIPNNKAALFIKENTPKNSVVLNGSFLYDPASLAGRKIYLGWPYFSWSAGYDTDNRFKTMKSILEETNKASACRKLSEEHINFLELQKPSPLEGMTINYQLFEDNFKQEFHEDGSGISIYDVNKTCGENI